MTAFRTTDEEWRDFALCAEIDPDLWFPGYGSAAPARRICRDCPVRTECLDFAITNDIEHGIWGGVGRQQRLRLREQRGIPSATQRDRAEKQEAARRLFAAGRQKEDIKRLLEISGDTLNTYLSFATREDTAA